MADSITPSAGDMTSPVPEQPARGEPRLLMRGINKSFGAVRALTDVDFEVYPGEVVGLVGDNGAGKSTLIKAIAGVGPADSGEIFVEGQPVKITSPQVATRLGIETVYQDLALCDNLDVVANLFLGLEEPTAALGVAQTRQVLNLILRLRDQGLAVVVISHNLADVFEVVDRVIVLRLGRRVATFDVKTTTPERVVSAITGAEFGQLRSATTNGNGVSEGVTNNE